ncbi:MAG: LysR family transcriptional regulator [Muricomes sp.]|nr:LysR family transcriptional regulator [Muricomes sp.]
MELKYLNTFKTILETGSFQKAAERLNYAQSTITLQVQLLEQELSVKLFEKIGRKMELSQAGKELLPYIDAVLAAVEQMENYGKGEHKMTGTLSIAIPETLLSYQMPQVLKTFRKMAPSIKLSLQTPNCYEIREKIINGVVDLGVHYDIGGYGSSLIVEKLGYYDLVLVGSTELDMKEQDFITKGQRKDICLLTMDKNSLYHKVFNDYLRTSDISLNGEMELVSTEAIKRSVIGNIGVSYLPRFTVAYELEQGIIQELSTSIQNRKIGAVCSYHKNKWITPAMDLFVRLLREQKPTK